MNRACPRPSHGQGRASEDTVTVADMQRWAHLGRSRGHAAPPLAAPYLTCSLTPEGWLVLQLFMAQKGIPANSVMQRASSGQSA